MQFLKKLSPLYNLAILFTIVGVLTRLALLFHPITQSSFGYSETIKIFLFGFISDAFVFIVASFFLWLYLMFLSNSKYNNPTGYIIFGVLVLLLLYVVFGNTILNEYGGSAPEIGIGFVALKTFLFGLLLFLPKYRAKIRFWLFSFVVFLFVFLIIQNAISEFLFWNEFGVRYNFIAVNYLIYTNEVIGNILESYPVIPIFGGLFLITASISYFIIQKSKNYLQELPNFFEKLKISALYLALFAASLIAIPFLSSKENSQNVFTNELQSSGLYKFYLAFMNSELDYFKFYKTIPNDEAFAILKKQIPGIEDNTTIRNIKSKEKEIRKNVVLITIESYSAEFLKLYGNEQNITPFLDSLAAKSLNFSNLYAVGNRTVRGLEAVSLCLPPTAGESVVKRKDNKNKFSTGSVFKQKGYQVNYLYGGDAYFDNMEDFFAGNSYGIVDKKTFNSNEITFANVWGVCDEDMANKAIAFMNIEHKTGKPFFNHWMTVSNHRPFTYPEGKIDISGKSKSREGGVKYTDYALNKFFKMAKKQAWYNNTVFVIVADHCASSSGKTELPLDRYRIPAMIFDPTAVPKNCNKLMSQIDIMPTAMGLLNFNYQSKFYGQDVLKTDYQPRALIATYDNLGLIKNNILTILSPKQKVVQFDLSVINNPKLSADYQIFYTENRRKTIDKTLENETISFYQTASEMLKTKKYQK